MDQDFNERYQVDLQPKNIQFRSKNLVKGKPMPIHVNKPIVENIEDALKSKQGKSKAGGNQNYVQFYAPLNDQFNLENRDEYGDIAELPKFEVENIPGPL